jgi:hypothetical protein
MQRLGTCSRDSAQAGGASGRKARQATADCLGALGAVDPARVQLDLAPPPSLIRAPADLLVRSADAA